MYVCMYVCMSCGAVQAVPRGHGKDLSTSHSRRHASPDRCKRATAGPGSSREAVDSGNWVCTGSRRLQQVRVTITNERHPSHTLHRKGERGTYVKLWPSLVRVARPRAWQQRVSGQSCHRYRFGAVRCRERYLTNATTVMHAGHTLLPWQRRLR